MQVEEKLEEHSFVQTHHSAFAATWSALQILNFPSKTSIRLFLFPSQDVATRM